MPRKVTVGPIERTTRSPTQRRRSRRCRRRRGPPLRADPRGGRRACRSSACRRSSTGRTSAPRRTRTGTTPPRRAGPTVERCSRSRRSTRWRSSCPSTSARRRASTTTPRPSTMPTARTSASTARTTSRRRPASGKVLLQAGNTRLPGLPDALREVGVYICYDRHFPEGARVLGLNGAEIRLQPVGDGRRPPAVPLEARAACPRRRQRLLRGGVQPRRHRGAVEHRPLLRDRYIVDPRGNFLATASEGQDELVVATCDLDMIEEVRRTWQFFRDRRPETYDRLVAL